MNRRQFLKVTAGVVLLGGAGAWRYGTRIEPEAIQVIEQQVTLAGLGAGLRGLRVVQLSDLHVGEWFPAARLERVMEMVREINPDLVWITGDFVLAGQDPLAAIRAFSPALTTLAAQYPIYAVLGNHDYVDDNDRLLNKTLAGLGIENVTNRYMRFSRGGDALTIAGIGTMNNDDMHLDRLAREIPRDVPAVLLAHEPDTAQWSAEKQCFALQVSGHSHGGQVNIPPVGPLILPWMGQMYPAGRYQINSMTLYTNRGLGMSHIPLRIHCPPEITVFTLQ